MLDCADEKGCMASLQGRKNTSSTSTIALPELFELATDPAEQGILAGQRSADELDRRRAELLGWRAQPEALYAARSND